MSDGFRIQLLVVEEQAGVRRLCSAVGASLGFACSEAESAESALARLRAESPNLVVAGASMEGASGQVFLEQVKRELPHTEVAILSGFGAMESAAQALRLGAYDYIAKPVQVEELKLVLQRMAEKIRLVEENRSLRERAAAPPMAEALDAAATAWPGAQLEPPSCDLEEMERVTIRRVFEEVKGDKALAGRKLGISRATLYRKLKRYGIPGRAASGASREN